MKIVTSIKPRTDGTVIALGASGRNYDFEASADGELECDVTDDKDLAALLSTHNFHPANEADFEAALKLADFNAPVAEGTSEGGEEDDELDAGTGLPVELNTPPQPARKRAKRGSTVDAG
jgi:hypothetical protein